MGLVLSPVSIDRPNSPFDVYRLALLTLGDAPNWTTVTALMVLIDQEAFTLDDALIET